MKRTVFDDSSEHQSAPQSTVRTDYRCRAYGCPNTGTIGGPATFGIDRSSVCYYHHQAELHEWPAVTAKIRANFDRMRNWGTISPELQAEHREQAQQWAMCQSGKRVVNVPGNLTFEVKA